MVANCTKAQPLMMKKAGHRGKRPTQTPSVKWVVCSVWWLVFPIELVMGSMINSMTVATLEPEKQHGHARD